MALITITTCRGCESVDIAKRVAETLNVKLFDDQVLKETALELGIRSKDLKSLDEKAPGFFDRLMSRRPELYLDFMEAVVYEVARQGDGVIVGHGSQVLLRDFGCALHVSIQASENSRIENLIHRHGLEKDAAEKLIRKTDHEQQGFFRYAFNSRINDPTLYDIIINTEKIGTDEAVNLIVSAASSDQIKACSMDAINTMARMAQIKQIHAALVQSDVNTSMIFLEIPEEGVVDVSGVTNTEVEKDRILGIIKDHQGISTVQNKIKVIPSDMAVE